ncbi:flagellar biosynthetic protein FliO [Denitrificimonas caeni]|uniref:flagellar biosynthetic protein FliO n=1 Tax=Denitrificimonas caeni TaxID=521720 RepID=UPI0019625B6E|nr:flagellar biosynthetic protein FliO [Denitrificimonas caeni]
MRLLIILMLASCRAWADEVAVAASNSTPKVAAAHSGMLESSQVSGQLLQLVFGLLLVIALIFLLAWVVRRIQQSLPVTGSPQVISLLASQALGPRDRLLLVQVGKEQILLGLTPGTIVPLHVLQEPVDIRVPEGNLSSAFAQRLAKVLKTTTKDKP